MIESDEIKTSLKWTSLLLATYIVQDSAKYICVPPFITSAMHGSTGFVQVSIASEGAHEGRYLWGVWLCKMYQSVIKISQMSLKYSK
jgi:hypothetical protein